MHLVDIRGGDMNPKEAEQDLAGSKAQPPFDGMDVRASFRT